MRMRGAAIIVLAMLTCADGRCGSWAGDDEAVASAVDTIAALCPCDAEWRVCMRRHVRAAAARIGLPKRCRTKAVRAARRRGCVATTCTTSTTTSVSTTSSTALREGLLGAWRLEGQVTENACDVTPDFDTVIRFTDGMLFGLRADGDHHAYPYVRVEDGRWQATSEWIGLIDCPTGEAGEPYWHLAGPVPDAETVMPVTGALEWVPPTQPYLPCPRCTVQWEGTMRRE
jgi:hypothetical protein